MRKSLLLAGSLIAGLSCGLAGCDESKSEENIRMQIDDVQTLVQTPTVWKARLITATFTNYHTTGIVMSANLPKHVLKDGTTLPTHVQVSVLSRPIPRNEWVFTTIIRTLRSPSRSM